MEGFFSRGSARLYYQSHGQGVPVVFLHGFGLDCRMWEPQLEPLARAFRVIRYDLRGYGRSSLPVARFRGEGRVEPYAQTDDLLELLRHLDAVPAHLVGLSMGGQFALRFALTYPQAVRSLALADSALDGYRWSAEWQERWKGILDAARAGDLAGARQRWLHHPLFAPALEHPAVAASLTAQIDRYSGWHWVKRDPDQVPNPPALERLEQVVHPALVVVGERDLADFQAIADILAGRLPKVRRVVIAGAGHMVNLEAPDRFNREVLEFLSRAS
ncbi:MAG TPA: alpha/beta fold hydrolase [Meiothermus sp.]|jgi:pimeloyl-ACP methyl ester carboxylesterase|nr:alpha/beta fold hydrolase [Meiothermus sp.]